VDDILEELGWGQGPAGVPAASNPLKTDPLLPRMARGEVYGLDELAALLGRGAEPHVKLDRHDLLARLTDWELQGLVVRLPGGTYGLR
jgi:hypothetical protein